MRSSVDMSALIHFLAQYGWDYTKLPTELQCVSRRQLQRTWHKRERPTYVTHTDHVLLALLEEDPPAKRPRGNHPPATHDPSSTTPWGA